MKLAEIPFVATDAPLVVRMTRMGYQGDLYFRGGAAYYSPFRRT